MQPDAQSGDVRAAIPAPVKFDPLASFLTTPVEIELGGRSFVIDMPMADFWMGVLLDEPIEWDAILPGLLPEIDQQWLEDSIMDGAIETQELQQAVFELIALVGGAKWWIVINICAVVRNNWDRLGGPVMRGMSNLKDLAFGAWLVAAFSALMERVDAKQAASFVATLTTPPPGWEEEIDPEEEEAAFMAAMAM